MLKKPPRVRDNNGALQVRVRLDVQDHFTNRLGRWDDLGGKLSVSISNWVPICGKLDVLGLVTFAFRDV